MRISEDLGVRWPLPTYQAFLSFERMIAGEWDDAIAELEAAFALAEEIGETYSRAYAHGVLSLISFHRNHLSQAQETAAAASRDLAAAGPGFSTSWAPWPHSLILEADGEPGRALATLAGIWDNCASSGLALEYPAIGADLVRLSLAAGDIGRARDVSAAVADIRIGNEVPWMTGAALRCRGLVEDNAEILQSAVAACAGGARSLGLALTCEDAGPHSPGRAGWTGAARCSKRRSASTSGSTLRATWRGPRRRCARRASGAVAAGRAAGRNRLGQPHPGRAHGRWPGR